MIIHDLSECCKTVNMKRQLGEEIGSVLKITWIKLLNQDEMSKLEKQSIVNFVQLYKVSRLVNI